MVYLVVLFFLAALFFEVVLNYDEGVLFCLLLGLLFGVLCFGYGIQPESPAIYEVVESGKIEPIIGENPIGIYAIQTDKSVIVCIENKGTDGFHNEHINSTVSYNFNGDNTYTKYKKTMKREGLWKILYGDYIETEYTLSVNRDKIVYSN